MKKLFCVILVIFLTGCSSQKANEPKKQENPTNHTTSIKSSTNHYSSSTETSSNNKLKKLQKVPVPLRLRQSLKMKYPQMSKKQIL